MNKDSQDQIIKDEDDAISFTARLIAHYRAQESKRENPLIIDPFAERLVGDLSSYFEKHKRIAGQIDYAIIRSYYIEHNLLSSWCSKHRKSQIVMLGAGLDTRAYRFAPLKTGTHTIYEIDLPIINSYKAKILQNETPLCNLFRLSLDLSNSDWVSRLPDAGFTGSIPTFWILEGLVYYLEEDAVKSMLKKISRISDEQSEIFVDICIPVFADLRYGPFTIHFKWGLKKEEVQFFFSTNGWKVNSSFADDHDQGRDVGQKGMIFIHGMKDTSKSLSIAKSDSLDSKVLKGKELVDFARKFATKIVSDIYRIVKIFDNDVKNGLIAYLKFIRNEKISLERIAKGFRDPLSIGNISPRLLGDPISISSKSDDMSFEEIESYVEGYLRAILQLLYCASKGLEGEQFTGTLLHTESEKTHSEGKIKDLLPLLKIMEQELANNHKE